MDIIIIPPPLREHLNLRDGKGRKSLCKRLRRSGKRGGGEPSPLLSTYLDDLGKRVTSRV